MKAYLIETEEGETIVRSEDEIKKMEEEKGEGEKVKQ